MITKHNRDEIETSQPTTTMPSPSKLLNSYGHANVDKTEIFNKLKSLPAEYQQIMVSPDFRLMDKDAKVNYLSTVQHRLTREVPGWDLPYNAKLRAMNDSYRVMREFPLSWLETGGISQWLLKHKAITDTVDTYDRAMASKRQITENFRLMKQAVQIGISFRTVTNGMTTNTAETAVYLPRNGVDDDENLAAVHPLDAPGGIEAFDALMAAADAAVAARPKPKPDVIDLTVDVHVSVKDRSKSINEVLMGAAAEGLDKKKAADKKRKAEGEACAAEIKRSKSGLPLLVVDHVDVLVPEAEGLEDIKAADALMAMPLITQTEFEEEGEIDDSKPSTTFD
jgi:hypothetical protein